MGWFGRKPRRIGFGGTPARGHDAGTHRKPPPRKTEPPSGTTPDRNGPWAGDADLEAKVARARAQIADLQGRVPIVGGLIARAANRSIDRFIAHKTGQPLPPHKRRIWPWMLVFVVFFFATFAAIVLGNIFIPAERLH